MDRPEGDATAQETIRLAWQADERSKRTGDPRDLDAAVAAWRPAVEALVIERFRAVLWSLALADLDRMSRPDLAERYRRAARGPGVARPELGPRTDSRDVPLPAQGGLRQDV